MKCNRLMPTRAEQHPPGVWTTEVRERFVCGHCGQVAYRQRVSEKEVHVRWPPWESHSLK
jgi:hypothetical protein